MSLASRLMLAVLVFDAVLLGLVELFFMPLRLPPSLGSHILPITAVLAGLTTPLLVRAAADLAPRVAVAGAPLGAWLLTVLVVGVTGPGGDVLLTDDLRPLLLLVAGVVPSAVVLGRLASGALEAATAPATAPTPVPAPEEAPRAQPDR